MNFNGHLVDEKIFFLTFMSLCEACLGATRQKSLMAPGPEGVGTVTTAEGEGIQTDAKTAPPRSPATTIEA
jgi:hypothetical protein